MPEENGNLMHLGGGGDFTLSLTGLEMNRPVSFAEWSNIVEDMRRVETCSQWWLGDLLLWGQRQFGEDWAQVLPRSVAAAETLRNYRWVAEQIPPKSRVKRLTWSHHQAVAGLPAADAEGLLARAAAEKLPVRALKQEARAVENAAPTFDPEADFERFVAVACKWCDTWPASSRALFWEKVAKLAASNGKPVRADMEAFARFWDAYPRKTAKQMAIKAWKRLCPDPALVEAMLAALERQKQSRQWREGVHPHPATWLNGRRWEDELPAANGTANGRPRPETTAEKIERIRREQAARDQL